MTTAARRSGARTAVCLSFQLPGDRIERRHRERIDPVRSARRQRQLAPVHRHITLSRSHVIARCETNQQFPRRDAILTTSTVNPRRAISPPFMVSIGSGSRAHKAVVRARCGSCHAIDRAGARWSAPAKTRIHHGSATPLYGVTLNFARPLSVGNTPSA